MGKCRDGVVRENMVYPIACFRKSDTTKGGLFERHSTDTKDGKADKTFPHNISLRSLPRIDFMRLRATGSQFLRKRGWGGARAVYVIQVDSSSDYVTGSLRNKVHLYGSTVFRR